MISLQFSMDGRMDGWTAGRTQARHDPGFFVRGWEVQARRAEYTHTHTHTHTHTCTVRQMNVHAQAEGWTCMYMYRRQTTRQFI